MNDYWNDPPCPPEPPECCGDIMDVDESGACVCQKCGKRIEPEPDIDPFDDMPACAFGDRPEDCGNLCRHGNDPASCGTCMHESDLAFDAMRERRLRWADRAGGSHTPQPG